jgi:hypothetical protein
MMSKTAIFIFSDPKSGGEEALGRAFNGLAAAYDIKQSGGEVSITFQGAGTRWPALITHAGHPLHDLYDLVKGDVVGVSCGCAEVFGATEGAKACGMPSISENQVPGTTGVAGFGKLIKFGIPILTF